MVLEIVWTPEVDREFDRIIEYLLTEWSEKEVIQFVLYIDRIIDHIFQYHRMFCKQVSGMFTKPWLPSAI
ncbi:MAG TPA: hypothetical protein DIW47_06060 [Bacteroidetes bacterium]|nr:hypothetical protein [Bacteroidota bacterium]